MDSDENSSPVKTEHLYIHAPSIQQGDNSERGTSRGDVNPSSVGCQARRVFTAQCVRRNIGDPPFVSWRQV